MTVNNSSLSTISPCPFSSLYFLFQEELIYMWTLTRNLWGEPDIHHKHLHRPFGQSSLPHRKGQTPHMTQEMSPHLVGMDLQSATWIVSLQALAQEMIPQQYWQWYTCWRLWESVKICQHPLHSCCCHFVEVSHQPWQPAALLETPSHLGCSSCCPCLLKQN